MNQSHDMKTRSSGSNKSMYTLMYTLVGIVVVVGFGTSMFLFGKWASYTAIDENNFILSHTEWTCPVAFITEKGEVACLVFKRKGAWQDGKSNKPNFGHRKHDLPKGESL